MLDFGPIPARKQRFKKRLGLLHTNLLRRRLKRRFSAAFNTPWTRRHWIHASLFATLGALIATIVPGFSTAVDMPSHVRATLPLVLPPVAATTDPSKADHPDWQFRRIESGQTLGTVFNALGLDQGTMHRVLDHPGARNALTRLRPGVELGFDIDAEGQLRTFRFDRDPSHRIELSLQDDQIQEKVIERPATVRTVVTSGEITHSLYAAGRKAGLSPAAINTMADEIFKYDIDFDKDVQPGDRFSIVMEEIWREGERVDSGKILGATFSTRGKTYTGFRYEHDGKVEYFDINGRPLKKSFIRMPIQYARLSSNFGARRHPILGTMRMHKGVDYAAPTGTPIMAAGDAKVQFVGTQRGYGNVVILDHGRGYTTLYGHMSRFAGIKQGQQIAQGTVIGYVGSTGLATGPHLHYEFRVNGQHRNPLSVTMPPPEPLRGPQLAAFRQQIAPSLARIQNIEALMYADAAPRPASAKKEG
ncbi:MAG: peptidoglycan DD-metalloendopeptidase family protein [Xanthomonadaceae bacterium]|jgi:murein DD-endopeptidase MepM/ murein hydrolase activator NlpD|nr:peptidoglycan DD-metalloendopeptidase family protein [Xanthomonadaceae bacterium]